MKGRIIVKNLSEIRNRKAEKVVLKKQTMFCAMQWTGKNERDFAEFLIGKTSYRGEKVWVSHNTKPFKLFIRGLYSDRTYRGKRVDMRMNVGDWLVWDPTKVDGKSIEIYKDDEYHDTFQKVEVGVHQWTKEDEEWEKNEREKRMREAMMNINITGI